MYMYNSYCRELYIYLPTQADNTDSTKKTESSDKLYVRHNGKWFQITTSKHKTISGLRRTGLFMDLYY